MIAPLMGRANPGHGQTCVDRRQGCTCYLYRGQHGSRAKVLRRRAQRATEKRQLATQTG